MRRNRRVTYRPSKGQSILGGVMGCVFVLIGLFVVIPSSAMGGGPFFLFGVAWTGIAGVIAGMNFYHAFGKGYLGPEIHIEDEEAGGGEGGGSATPQERLEQLRSLYDQRLITQEEYEAKRTEILKEL